MMKGDIKDGLIGAAVGALGMLIFLSAKKCQSNFSDFSYWL